MPPGSMPVGENMSVKAYFLLFMGVLVAAALAAASTVMLIEMNQLEGAERTEQMTRAFGGILEIQQRASSERGHFNARLVGNASSDDVERQVVSNTDRAFGAGIALLKVARGNDALVERLQEIRTEFRALRTLAIGQLETSGPNESLAPHYAGELSRLIEQLEAIAGRIEQTAAASAGPLARSYVELPQLVAIMRGYASRRATQMITLVGTKTAITPEISQALGDHSGRVPATWRRIEQVAALIQEIAAPH